jgi:hypothetical protein
MCHSVQSVFSLLVNCRRESIYGTSLSYSVVLYFRPLLCIVGHFQISGLTIPFQTKDIKQAVDIIV